MQPRMSGPVLAVLALVLAVWAWLALVHPVPFWQQQSDYPWYSVSQAITTESQVAGTVASNKSSANHPAIPFAAVSWIALRVSTAGTDGLQRVRAVLQDPEPFWTAAKAAALLLTLAGVLAYRQLFAGSPLAFLVACACFFGFSPAVVHMALVQLTVESFALPFIALSYLAALRFLQELCTGAGLRRLRVLSAALGALAGFGMSLKIYYLAPSAGVAVASLGALALGWARPSRVLDAAAIGLGVFAATAALLFLGVLGPLVTQQWAQWNLGVLSHQGRYGSGSTGVLSGSAVLDAAGAIVRESSGAFLLACALLLALLVAQRRSPAATGAEDRARVLFVAAVLTGASIHLLGLLKHYLPHYAIPLCATLPCLLAAWKDRAVAPRAATGFAAAAALLAAFNVTMAVRSQAKDVAVAGQVQADFAAIASIPLQPGRFRIWGYGSAVPVSVAPMILDHAGSLWSLTLAPAEDPADAAPYQVRRSAHWALVMLPKVYFPSRESIASTVRNQPDFSSSDFRLCPADRIEALRQFFVVTPAPRLPDGGCK